MADKLYKIQMPIIFSSRKSIELPQIRLILKEILGYYDNEIDKLTDYLGNYLVAKNVTIEQAIKIFKPIIDMDLKFFLFDNETNEWYTVVNELGEIPRETPKEHYYDEPVLSREQLYNPFGPYGNNIMPMGDSSVSITPLPTQSSSSKPVVTCPYCQSTDTKKISTASKAASVAFWGIFSQKVKKQWHCNKCGSDF